jgi:protein-S-isoprenylcysteine O-methyltransferase Ste14
MVYSSLLFDNLYLHKKDPALLEERYRKPGAGNQEGWDRYVVYGHVVGFFIWIIIMPLDAKRFGWSPVSPIWLNVLGATALVGSFFFFFRSFTDNTILSPLVRIQEVRMQRVVSTGVYGFVRHPMYLGVILMFIGVPLLLGSIYGLLAALALTILLLARILGEERMLTKDLEGYKEYMQKVRYRLVPFFLVNHPAKNQSLRITIPIPIFQTIEFLTRCEYRETFTINKKSSLLQELGQQSKLCI